MKVSFEFTTENEDRNVLLLVAEFCNALAGNAKQPVLSAATEPEDEERPVKTVAEIIAEERAKTASMKAAAPTMEEPEQISEDAAAKHYEDLKAEEAAAAKKEKAAKRAAAKAEKEAVAKAEKEAAERAAKMEEERQAILEAERQAETDRLTAEAAPAAAAPELTVKDCRDLAMKALNKQRKDLIQEAFAKVGCPNFPALEKKPEMFTTFMEHINAGLNG